MFLCKQKTAYELRISDWSSDVCSSDLRPVPPREADVPRGLVFGLLPGFTSFVAHAGAPPYQMYVVPQRLEKMAYAGTSTILFAIVNAAKLVPRSEGRRVGEGSGSTCRCRRLPSH